MAFGRLFIDVFDTHKLREMYLARNAKLYVYKHVVGGDQANNRGMLLDWRACKENTPRSAGWEFLGLQIPLPGEVSSL